MPEYAMVWLVLAFLLTWLGFAILALTQERHFGLFYLSFKPFRQRILVQTAMGVIAICLALPACIAAQGGGFGGLLWVLMLTACAVTLALQLTWAPGALWPLAWLIKRLFHDSFSLQRKLTTPR